MQIYYNKLLPRYVGTRVILHKPTRSTLSYRIIRRNQNGYEIFLNYKTFYKFYKILKIF